MFVTFTIGAFGEIIGIVTGVVVIALNTILPMATTARVIGFTGINPATVVTPERILNQNVFDLRIDFIDCFDTRLLRH